MSSDQQEFDRAYTHLESAAYINQALLKDVEELFSTHGLESMKPLYDGLMALKNMNDLALKDAGRHVGIVPENQSDL